MEANNVNIQLLKKPLPLRLIFILNAIMMVLPFGFYYVITTNNIELSSLNPTWMLYTAAGYILSFIFLVIFILKRNFVGIRIVMITNILISLPAKAIIGITVAFLSLGLTLNKGVKAYFLVD